MCGTLNDWVCCEVRGVRTCRTDGHEGTRKRSLGVCPPQRAVECLTVLEDARTDRVLVKGKGTPGRSGRGRGSDGWL